MTKFDKFNKLHENAIAFIKEMQNSDKPAMKALTNFFLETDINSYDFMPIGWEGSLDTSTSFQAFLSVVHHALFDDGDISFPIVNDSPRISFVWQHEENYADYVLTQFEKESIKTYGSTYTITQCSDVFDFIKKHKEYHTNRLKYYFIETSASHGIEYAKKNYSDQSHFDPNWEFDADILNKISNLKKSPRFKM